jgi:hypothetical protein
MVRLANKILRGTVAQKQFDDGLITRYNVVGNGNYLSFNGIGRAGIRFDSGSASIGSSVKSVLVRGRKYGSPTGNITVNVRKASDDSAVTIGIYPIQNLLTGIESSFVVRLRSNTYNMVLNDLVTVEFPSNATNGLDIALNNSLSNPQGLYTSRSHNGTIYASTASPVAITVKS